MGLAPADLIDLARERLDALVEPEPVLVMADDQVALRGEISSARFFKIGKSDLRRAFAPGRTAMPCSIRKARIWLIVPVLRATSLDRTWWQAWRSS